MLPDDSNPSRPLTSPAAASERIRWASASPSSPDTRFSAFPVGALGVSNKDFIALPFLAEGLGEETRAALPCLSALLQSDPMKPKEVQLIFQVQNPNPSLLACGGYYWGCYYGQMWEKMIVSPCSSGIIGWK